MSVVPLPSADVIALRRYRSEDAEPTLVTFREAVRRGASEHYSLSQCMAWAPPIIDLRTWAAARASRPTWVAEVKGEVVGFSDLKPDGEIDMLFVHPDHTRQGVGRALLEEAERAAREADMARLHARVSLTAEPLFRRLGFVIVSRQWAELRGERLAQAMMEKLLEPVL